MDATYIMQAIQHLKSNILLHVRHRALLQHTGEPIVDEHQLFFMLLPQLNGETVDEQYTLNATTVGIMHASLMEHDRIKEQDATSKEQQLTVLSGDYYSGRYYELLAHSGNISLISQISQGIVERCEHEMTIYEPSKRTMAQWAESLLVIESKLITQFYKEAGFEQYAKLAEVALAIVRLQRESKFIAEGNPARFGQVMLATVERTLEAIEQQVNELQANLRKHYQMLTLHPSLQHYIEQMTAYETV